MSEVVLRNGQTVKMDQVREYFEYLFRAEESGERFPADLDAIWPVAYSSKSNAKKALISSPDFFEGIDYHIFQSEDMVKRPQGGGPQRERIVMTIQCLEFLVARKERAVFEVYRQCRIAMTNAARAKARVLPYHLRRYMANYDQVPIGYFSILQETSTRLVAPLEIAGYTIPDNMVPDISVGQIFCRWLRDVKGIDPSTFSTYTHAYEDGRKVPAKLYPIALLADFVTHFQTEWLANRAETYFKDRDPTALQHIKHMLQGPIVQAAVGVNADDLA